MATIDTRLRLLLGTMPDSYWKEKIQSNPGVWGERILSQLVFAHEMSKVQNHAWDDTLLPALAYVEEQLAGQGAITKQTALHAEQMLAPLAESAKAYAIHCVAHAHIDMNWMWPWDETVAVTLDTMRTMLRLMEEYPSFCFSQSQAAVYRIIEQYAPAMLEEIKARVHEGRWEVTASHWVEADKNMPSGESLSRHLLYAKRYLSKLLDIDPDSLDLDFEPDTFGHSLQVPELLAHGGVRYYYHCRGSDGPIAYTWKSPSGSAILCYREPTWYNDFVQPILGSYVPSICRQTRLLTHLYVYGVGDHGGGPTRRDLERLAAMNDWPIYPRIVFGTLAGYYAQLDKVREQLPVVTGEQNCVFTGCYTSQTRIKTANRIGEATLHQAELFSAVAGVAADTPYPAPAYEEAWRNVLFNQFHDILPGSGVLETREHALGLFQQTMAIANTNRKQALESIAAMIDTAGLASSPDCVDTAEGAGVGYGAGKFQITQVERGGGSTRIVHVFNPAPYEREEVVEVTLWDWNSPIRTLTVKDGEGREVPYQWIDNAYHKYWSHHYLRLLVFAKVPGCGYNTYTISEGEAAYSPFLPTDPRVEREARFVLENDRLRVQFHPVHATIVSMIDKQTGAELVRPSSPAGCFRLIQEDPIKGMSSWRVGRYMEITDLHLHVKIEKLQTGELRQSLTYSITFNRSSLKVTVSLDRDRPVLRFDTACDWQEIGTRATAIPQLNFQWPLAYSCDTYKYDVPAGIVARPAADMDVPANSWAFGERSDGGKHAFLLTTDNKYGYRGVDQSLAVSLIRSSFDPDPYPELGNHHKTSIAVCVVDAHASNRALSEMAYSANHPLTVLSGTAHSGKYARSGSFLRVEAGTVVLSALKMAEDGADKRWIIRLYETEGQSTAVKLRLRYRVADAYRIDTNEHRIAETNAPVIVGGTVAFQAAASSVVTLCVVLAPEPDEG